VFFTLQGSKLPLTANVEMTFKNNNPLFTEKKTSLCCILNIQMLCVEQRFSILEPLTFWAEHSLQSVWGGGASLSIDKFSSISGLYP
jgi:hypothetical protein